jgi:hypothetical protein
MAEADSSWMAPTVEQRPAPPPRMAALPPNVRLARPVGAEPEPEPEPFPPPPPTPTPLSEAEARALLAERQQTMRDAASASDAAQAALHRAQQHVEACAAELAGFVDIDEQLKALHIEALRGGAIRPQIVVSPELRRRITEHEQARLACDAAAAAVSVFAKEAEHARQEATDARLKLSNAADRLVERHALARLRHRQELARALEAADRDLASYEQFSQPRVPRPIAEALLELYASGRMRAVPLSTERWRSLHDRLAADADAELTLTP